MTHFYHVHRNKIIFSPLQHFVSLDRSLGSHTYSLVFTAFTPLSQDSREERERMANSCLLDVVMTHTQRRGSGDESRDGSTLATGRNETLEAEVERVLRSYTEEARSRSTERDEFGQTPAHLLCEAGSVSDASTAVCMRLIVERRGCSLSAVDNWGRYGSLT